VWKRVVRLRFSQATGAYTGLTTRPNLLSFAARASGTDLDAGEEKRLWLVRQGVAH
jgi:uncharacterized transporter YbjL